MLRNRSFVYLSAALIAATLAKDAGARMPDEIRPQAETCLAEVTPACLLDLAMALARTAPAGGVDVSWFSSAIIERQFEIGNFAAGAELAASLEPSSLLDLVEGHASDLRDAEPALLAPIHRAAEAQLEAARAERDPVALGVQAEAVRILVASGATGRAAEVLAEAVERFRAGLAAEHDSYMRVCGALGDAVAALRDPEIGEAFVTAVVGPDWRVGLDPFEVVAENCLASVGNVLAAVGDPDGAIAAWRALGGPESRHVAMPGAILVSLAKANLPAAFTFVADLPRGIRESASVTTPGQREMALDYAIGRLVSEGRLDEAEALLAALEDRWSRENELVRIAQVHLDAGNLDEARRLLAVMTDPGGRARIQIDLGLRLASAGDIKGAQRLLDEAGHALGAEASPTRLVFIGLGRAFALLELGDTASAKRAADEALRHAGDILDPFMNLPDPMVMIDIAAFGAALQHVLGDLDAADAILDRLAGDFLESPDDWQFADLMVARHLSAHGHADLAGGIVVKVLRSVYDDERIGPEDAVLSTVIAAEALAGL
jgi:tetratricopeptide (TPR) repeat protein